MLRVSPGSTFFTSCFEFWGFACTRELRCQPRGLGELQAGGEPLFPPRLLVGIGPEMIMQARNMPLFFLFWLNTLAVGFVC